MGIQGIRRIWRQSQGEQVLLTTFWPNDYRRDAVYTLDGTHYRITRYVRSAADPRFFEVWGKVAVSPEVHRQGLERNGHTLAELQLG